MDEFWFDCKTNDWAKWKWEENDEAAAALKRMKEANGLNPNLQPMPR